MFIKVKKAYIYINKGLDWGGRRIHKGLGVVKVYILLRVGGVAFVYPWVWLVGVFECSANGGDGVSHWGRA